MNNEKDERHVLDASLVGVQFKRGPGYPGAGGSHQEMRQWPFVLTRPGK